MQLRTLIKRLQNLESLGHGRDTIVVAAKDMYEQHNRVFSHVDVSDVEADWILTIDGDGFQKHRQDGTECGRNCIVLK